MIFPLRLLFTSIVILISVYLVPGLHIDSLLTALGASITVALAITLLKPFFIMVHINISLMMYGFIMLLSCIFMVYFASLLYNGFVINHFLAVVGLGIIITGVSVVMNSMVPSE